VVEVVRVQHRRRVDLDVSLISDTEANGCCGDFISSIIFKTCARNWNARAIPHRQM
jgi:hypothetical protein